MGGGYLNHSTLLFQGDILLSIHFCCSSSNFRDYQVTHLSSSFHLNLSLKDKCGMFAQLLIVVRTTSISPIMAILSPLPPKTPNFKRQFYPLLPKKTAEIAFTKKWVTRA